MGAGPALSVQGFVRRPGLRRVLKPGGRLLVGELAIDPEFIPRQALRTMARDAGLVLERTAGPPFGYWAVLRPE